MTQQQTVALRTERASSMATLPQCAALICDNPKLAGMIEFIQHGDTSCLLHSVAVAYFAIRMAELFHLRIRRDALVRGAMLHDYFLYDWHKGGAAGRFHGFTHPRAAWENARLDYDLEPVERDIILRHMFPLTPVPPRNLEGVLVSLADKGCSLYETFQRGAYPRLCAQISDYVNFRMR